MVFCAIILQYMGKNNRNTTVISDVRLSALTRREQEIFDMLLAGSIPKEIAHSLNISINTFKTHQKNLYQKLSVNTIRELVTMYAVNGEGAGYKKPQETDKAAVFTRWIVNKDELGSYVNITEQIEHIEKQYFPVIIIAGKVTQAKQSFAGAYTIPAPSTLEDMKKMNRFSLKILGDGNSYAVTIPTTDTRLNAKHNHYRKLITTINGEISDINVDIDELAQVPYWGNQVPFIKDNIEFFQIHAYATSEFKIKIWDIKFLSD